MSESESREPLTTSRRPGGTCMDTRNCLNDAELRQIIDSVCAPEQQSRCEQHLHCCNDCRQRLEELSGTIPRHIATSRIPASSPVLDGVMAGLVSLRKSSRQVNVNPDALANRVDVAFPYLAPADREGCLGRLGNYEVVRLLGRGGMGVVFAAFDPLLNREVAIKVPLASVVATQEAQARFVREARAIAAVRHDNIVTVYAAEEVNGTLILVMELVHGESLADRLRVTTKLPWQAGSARKWRRHSRRRMKWVLCIGTLNPRTFCWRRILAASRFWISAWQNQRLMYR